MFEAKSFAVGLSSMYRYGLPCNVPPLHDACISTSDADTNQDKCIGMIPE